MGLTKEYLRYVPGPVFGLIGSGRGGAIHIPGKKNLVAASNAENVVVWNIKTGEKLSVLGGGGEGGGGKQQAEVTKLAVNEDGSSIAVGYGDGTIKLFHSESSTGDDSDVVTFAGHKSAVLSLAFDQNGFRLASGGSDTVVIVWDVVNECGLYRLQGHKGPVTNVSFMKWRKNILVSASKDSLVKFWDLDIQHCFKTLPGHLTEVWDFVLVKDDRYLIVGSGDSELRVFKLNFNMESDNSMEIEPTLKKLKIKNEKENDEELEEEDEASNLKIERLGSLLRVGQGRVSNLVIDETKTLIACHGNDNVVELFKICSPEEVKKRLQKKAKKERRKKDVNNEDKDVLELPESTIQEQFRRLKVFKAGGKVRSLDLKKLKNSKAEVLVSTANNLLETFIVDFEDKDSEAVKTRSFNHPGHRSDVRTVVFSSDSTAIASVSQESLKIWNRATQICIRTIESGYGLCCSFVVGDRQIVVGTKKGSLQIFDLNSAEMTEEISEAHNSEIWSLCQTPDKSGFVTASSDQSVKFWVLEFVEKEDGNKVLSMVHVRTLQLNQDVLSVRLSPDGKFLAVSLLDEKIKVFFVDSFKLLHDLFGHKLPALCIDIAHDSSILVSASADRNVKIWDLVHGQCEKSIFAHESSITAVQFVPNTHLFFTVAKDGKVKQWDADKFERILTLHGHHGEIWALAISPNGKYIVSAGHDKTLRLWEKTNEPLVLEDERETEREAEAEQQLTTLNRDEDKTIEGSLATKRTGDTERGAERLMEAIDIYRQYKESEKQQDLPALMMMYGKVSSAEEFMLLTLLKIRSSELEETLLVLSLDVVVQLLEIIEVLFDTPNFYVETLARTFFFLVEIHFGPLSSSGSSVRSLIERLRKSAERRLTEVEDVVGFNVAALTYIQHEVQYKQKVQFFADAAVKYKQKKKKKKQKEKALKTAIISI